MADVLVVYFSRSGSTERLATALAAQLGADLDRVRPAASYAGLRGYFRGVWHSLNRRTPTVECDRDPAAYRLVVIGSPVWAGLLSTPLRGYLARFGGRIGAAAAFWVSGSGAHYRAVADEIETRTGRKLLASVGFAQREVGRAAGDAKLRTFAGALHAPRRKAA
jgi:menaquinone-dependent protoporphyrinogen IX oxidase